MSTNKKLFAFSQSASERARLANLFDNLLTSFVPVPLDEVLAAKQSVVDSDYACIERLQGLIKREQQALKITTFGKGQIRSRIKDLDAQLKLANDDYNNSWQDLQSFKDLEIFQNRLSEIIEISKTDMVVAIAQYSYYIRAYKDKEFLADTRLVSLDDCDSLRKWAREKTLSYCIGYLLRQHTSSDYLLASETDLLSRAEEMLGELQRAEVYYAPNASARSKEPYHAWNAESAYVKSSSYIPSIDSLQKEYPTLSYNVISLERDLVREYYYNAWFLPLHSTCLPIFAIPVCLAVIELRNHLATLEKAEKEKQEMLESVANAGRKFAMVALMHELKAGYKETIPVPRYWDKNGSILQSSDYISDGKIFFQQGFFRTLDVARLFFPCDPNSKCPFTPLHKNSNRYKSFTTFAKDIASKAYKIAKPIGSRATNIEGLQALTYFASSDNQVLVINTGYLQMLSRIGLLAQVAHYTITDNMLVLRNHQNEVLAAIMHVNLTPKSNDYLDLNLLASATNQAASIAA